VAFALLEPQFHDASLPLLACQRLKVNSQMDALAVGSFYLERSRQPHASLPGTFESLPD